MKKLRVNLILVLTCLMTMFLVMSIGVSSSVYAQTTASVSPIFKMENGASVRLEPDSSGIRWSTTINESYINTLNVGEESKIELGVVVAPTNNLIDKSTGVKSELTEDTNKAKLIPCTKKIVFDADGNFEFSSAIIYNNLNEEERIKAYAVDLTARAYVKVDGVIKAYVDNETLDTSRSIRSVAYYASTVLGIENADVFYNSVNTDYKDEVTGYIDSEGHEGAANIYNLSADSNAYAYIGTRLVGAVTVSADGKEINVKNASKIEDLELEKTYELTIFDKDNNVYVQTFKYATKVIDEKEDLAYFALATVTKGNYPDISDTNKNAILDATRFDGYYVVEKDIDATGYVHDVTSGTYTYNIDDKTNTLQADCVFTKGFNSKYPHLNGGLTGTFDGNGHTISNLTVMQNGLFGLVTDGTIKNIGFDNVTLKAQKRSDNAGSTATAQYTKTGLFAYSMQRVTIDNLYVKANVTGTTGGSLGDAKGDRGLLCFKIGTSTINNCLIECQIANTTGVGHYAYGSIACMEYNKHQYGNVLEKDTVNLLKWNDVFVISTSELFAYASTWNGTPTILDNLLNKNSIIYKTGIVKRYEDLSAMQNDKTANEESLNTFSSTYWTVENGVPTWNSAKKSAN